MPRSSAMSLSCLSARRETRRTESTSWSWTTLRLLKTALEEKFYNVTAMANGKIAEKYLQTKTVDLILLDYQMPMESGAEVLKWIRADLCLKDIPVIFLTGVSDADKVQEVISMKPQGYLLKPVNMERLFIMIRNLI